jgi:RNA polymerase sigma-70 factor (ECF subfamily)
MLAGPVRPDWNRLGNLTKKLSNTAASRNVSKMTTVVDPTPIGTCMSEEPGWEEQSDETLLLRYRLTGDREAFEELVHRYEREIYSYLRRYIGDEQMAEDAFQGTFLQVHLKRDQFQEGRRLRPWLYTIATNQAIDLQRRNKRHRMVSLDGAGHGGGDDSIGALIELLESGEAAPLDDLETEERRQWVHRSVADLPEQLRSAVALVYYQGLKYREAADVLQIPVGTVKSRLHSALLKLNQAWKSSKL